MNRIDREDSEMATAKKTTARKKAAKKTTAGKKTAVRKTSAKKPAAKKTAVKKTPASKKVAGGANAKQSAPAQSVTAASEKDLQALAMDIDRQMKVLAEMNTRVIIAKDQLADFQEMISEKIKTFQQRNAGAAPTGQKDMLAKIRETRDEAAKMFKDSKALHETYESLARHFEKGRVAAVKEMKKAEVAFLEKFHEVEARVVKKAGEIKKNLKHQDGDQ